MKLNSLLLISCAFLFASNAIAETKITLSPGLSYFNYEEFGLDNATLNKEIGLLPGISFTLQQQEHSIGAHIFSGEVEYDGHTQSGDPHTTNTDESLYYFYYRYDFLTDLSHHNYFLSVNYNFWERFIQANNNVGSLYEEYSWWHLEAGMHTYRQIQNQQKINYEIAIFRTFNGEILVDLENFDYGKPVLDLGDKFGARGMISYDLKTDYNTLITMGLEYKFWGFGRSNTKNISDGVTTISVTEPESETHLLRFFVQFKHNF